NEDNTSTAEIWQNKSVLAQNNSFSASFDMIASQAKMEGVTGLSSSAADSLNSLVASVRFAPNGLIDAANGATYQSAASLAYQAGVKYRVVMSADLATARYSVTVTPQGGNPVKIASNWRFRDGAPLGSGIGNVAFMSKTGAHSV